MNQQAETVYVEDINQFVRIMMAWHAQKIAEFEHMTKIPKGIEVTINDAESFILDGDLHTGFVMGVTMALVGMSHLPFEAEFEPSGEESLTTDESVN